MLVSIATRLALVRQVKIFAGAKSSRGFTLLELMMVCAIIGILATIALSVYQLYVLRAQTAQKLVDYDHIRTVVAIEEQAHGIDELHMGSQPGKVPPKLTGLLETREFLGLDGMTWQLILAPAGTFASYPNDEVYALISSVNNPPGYRRQLVLRDLLPHSSGDKIWVHGNNSDQLIFPVNPGGGRGSGSGPGSASSRPNLPSSDAGTSRSAASIASEAASSSRSDLPSSSGGTSSSPSVPPSSSPETSSSASTPDSSSPSVSSSSSEGAGPEVPPGGTNVDGNAENNGGNGSVSITICVYGKDGKPLTGQGNTAIRFRITTPYASFQEDLRVDPATGCLTKSYSGLPPGGAFRAEVLDVVDYNPPNSGGTSSYWDGVKPVFNVVIPNG